MDKEIAAMPAHPALQRTRKERIDWYKREWVKRVKGSFNLIAVELRNDPMEPWLATHNSFEAWCLEELGMTARRIQQICAAHEVREILMLAAPELAPEVARLKEGPLREIVTTPPEKRVEVLRAAVAEPGRNTARKIKMAKARVIEVEPTNGARLRCPHCGQRMP